MKRFVLFVVMVLIFGFINVNEGECKEIKLKPGNINITGVPFDGHNVVGYYYGLDIGNDNYVILGYPGDMPDKIDKCLSDNQNKKVRIQGKYITVKEKGLDGSIFTIDKFDNKTITCTPVK